MLLTRFFILSILLISSIAQANPSCQKLQMAGQKYANSAEFWDAYTKSNPKTDVELDSLMAEFDRRAVPRHPQAVHPEPVGIPGEVPIAPRYRMTRDASKELGRLQPKMRTKLDQVLQLAHSDSKTFWHELRTHPGGYRLEKLKDGSGYSVKLNDGYRVVFKETEDGVIEFLSFSKDFYKH